MIAFGHGGGNILRHFPTGRCDRVRKGRFFGKNRVVSDHVGIEPEKGTHVAAAACRQRHFPGVPSAKVGHLSGNCRIDCVGIGIGCRPRIRSLFRLEPVARTYFDHLVWVAVFRSIRRHKVKLSDGYLHAGGFQYVGVQPKGLHFMVAPGFQSTSALPPSLAARAMTKRRSDNLLRYVRTCGLTSSSAARAQTARSARRHTVQA